MKQVKVQLLAMLSLFTLLLAACGGGTAAPSATTAPAAGGEATAAPAAAEPTAAAPAAAATEAPATTDATAEPTPETSTVGSGSTKVVIWHNWQGAYYDAIQKLFADYATKNNVTIDLVRVPDVSAKAQVAVPSGQGPDLVAWVNDQIGSQALAEIIVPVDDYGINADYLKQNFTDVAANAVTYEGKTWAVPESMEALTFIYNKALISETDIPKDTDALIAKTTEWNAANSGKYFFIYNARNDGYFSAPWWQGAGVELVKPDGSTTLNSEAGVAAGTLIQQFSKLMPKELDYNVADSLFKEGKAAIIMNGPWSIADYEQAKIDFGLATIPVVTSSGKPGAPMVGVKVLMLANKAKQPEAAAEVMKYWGSKEVQLELAKANKQVPANKAAQDEMKSDPVIGAFIAQAANGIPQPNSPFMGAMWDPLAKTIESIWNGTADPKAAVEAGAALYDEKAADLK
ncbi:extracellular solute-binding protein [Chloroflexia bacterium SDU3-3]|nr:extracellular solute-binding protein [Chloroflexia bacterium SDU3-3]